MRSVIALILISALVGSAVGGAIAVFEIGTEIPPLPSTPVAVGAASPEELANQPKVEIDEVEYHFGNMQRGATKTHTYVISNGGDAPLRLEVGTPSCKCTVGELEKDVLQPGESVDLDVEWVARAAEGPFRQRIPLITNDPLQSRVELAVVGEVTKPDGLVPSEFSFGRVGFGEEATAQVYLMSYLQDSVEVSSLSLSDETTREHFDVQIEPVEPDQLPDKSALSGVRIQVTAKSDLPVGRFLQWLSLKTNLPDSEEVNVPITGRVVGDITVSGRGWNQENDTLRLGRVLSDQGKQVTLHLIVRGEHAGNVQFEVAEVDPEELIVTLGEPKQFPKVVHVPLTLELPAGMRPMVRLNPDTDDPAAVKLKTTHPLEPEVVLNLRFAIEG